MMRTNCIMRWSTLCLALTLSAVAAMAQPRPTGPVTSPATMPGGMPGAPGGAPPKPGPKPYKEVITEKAVTSNGLFKVHKVEDKFFFEIADTLLNRDVLVVNRITKSAADARNFFFGYAGDQIGENVIRFEKGPNNKVFLKKISFGERSKDSSQAMFRAVTNSNLQPIVAAFDVKSLGKDSTGVVIELTDFISSDNDILNFSGGSKSLFQVGSLQPDKSYIVGIKSFPINTEIKTVKTYSRAASPGGAAPNPFAAPPQGFLTMELNSSMVLLPKTPMQARLYDPRIGFFSRSYTDFDANPQGVETVRMITRWRLEPKDGEWERYYRGEVVEPKKPIVYYIDPATPKKWVPYLILGVNDWQPAFEKAGFKNAIMAKVAPTPAEDPTWSLEDARNSAIVYKPSNVPNASGPHVGDPRSGEILESHINWYHNVMELLRNWYFVQCSPTDARARKMMFDDELMGQLIRFVSSHEVGHTLGLRHNFGSSSTTPVENMRNKAWVEANGHTPSIMDYARFNYVAQPEDNISPVGLYPRIGEYDRWAIEWGYKILPNVNSPEDEKAILNRIVIDKLKDKRYWFGTETNPDDPRSQNEDLGDNSMKASSYGIKNLKRIIPNLPSWTRESNEGYASLGTLYSEVVGQFTRYVGHVSKNVGGIYETPKMTEQDGAVYEHTPKATQKEAMAWMNDNVFNTPVWLVDNNIFSKTGSNAISVVSSIQERGMNAVLNANTMTKLINFENAQGAATAYTVDDLLGDLKKGIWGELTTRKPIDVYRRNLQKAYVERINSILNPAVIQVPGLGSITSGPDTRKSDISSIMRGHLRELRGNITAAAAGFTDKMSRYHLQDLADRIGKILDPK